MTEYPENPIERRIAEASQENARLLAAVDDIDFSSRKAITNEMFRRMVALKVAFNWADLKICYEVGVVHVTLKTFLVEEEAARDIWDAAKIAYTTRLTDLAEKTIESVMNGSDENAKVKAAMFVLERRNPDYKRDAGEDANQPRALIAQQIVVKFVTANAKPKEISTGVSVDQGVIDIEAEAEAIDEANRAATLLSRDAEAGA